MAPSTLRRQVSLSIEDLSHDTEVLAVVVPLLVLAVAGVAARLTSKSMRKQIPLFSLDDYLLIISFFLYLAEAIIICWSTYQGGLGHHAFLLDTDAITTLSMVSHPYPNPSFFG